MQVVELEDDDDDISMLELVLAMDAPVVCGPKQEWLWGSSPSWTINLSMRLTFKARDKTKKCLEEKKVSLGMAEEKREEKVCVEE